MSSQLKMICSLCGAENDFLNTKCVICDSPLSQDVSASVSGSEERFSKKRVTLFQGRWKRIFTYVGLLLLIGVPWILMVDLFQEPEDVLESRKHFDQLRAKYEASKDKWDFQKDQILKAMKEHRQEEDIGKKRLIFEAIPLEILMSFLMEDLNFSATKYQGATVFPAASLNNPTMILSKYESYLGPFSIVLSLEIELFMDGEQIMAKLRRLRRGSRDVSPSLSWVYFGAELQALRAFETFSGGLSQVRLYQKDEKMTVQDDVEVLLSWHYFHRPLLRL